MKFFRLVLVLLPLASGALLAQQDPEPIPDFSQLDEYFYIPKTTLSFGFRGLSGARTSFAGTATIASPENPGNATDSNISRTYHDGLVSPDSRGTTIDNGDGTTTFIPIAPDGRTNTWSFSDDKQSAQYPGYIAMHTYSADVTDPTTRNAGGSASVGMELAISRDMGKLLFNRLTWNLSAGMTINDLSASRTAYVQAAVTTKTDLYSLYGEVAPTAPYSAPSSTTTTITDASGNAVLNDDGSSQTVTNDTTKLLGNTPNRLPDSTVTNSTAVSNRWKLKGAYYTFRAGPTLSYTFGRRVHFIVGGGVAVIYAGSEYSVDETFTPDTGAVITESLTNEASKILLGSYVDATLQFDLTARTGLYAGALLQNSGDYHQSIKTDSANYTTKVEFGSQGGFRAGMTVRF